MQTETLETEEPHLYHSKDNIKAFLKDKMYILSTYDTFMQCRHSKWGFCWHQHLTQIHTLQGTELTNTCCYLACSPSIKLPLEYISIFKQLETFQGEWSTPPYIRDLPTHWVAGGKPIHPALQPALTWTHISPLLSHTCRDDLHLGAEMFLWNKTFLCF